MHDNTQQTNTQTQAFAYFDKDFDGVLTVSEMKSSVVAIFKERKNMAASLEVGDRDHTAAVDCDHVSRACSFTV